MKTRKTVCFITALLLAACSFGCSRNDAVKPGDAPEKNISESVENISENSKNKITVFYDEVRISDTDLAGAVPVAASADKYYYSKNTEMYQENPDTSTYSVSIADGSVSPAEIKNIKAENIIFSSSSKTVYTEQSEVNYELISEGSNGSTKKTEISRPLFTDTDSAGNIWLYSGVKLFKYSPELEKLSETDIYSQLEPMGLGNKYIYDMCVTDDGNVYFVISTKGECHSIFTVDGSGKLKDITGEMTDLADNVNSLYADKNGNLVLCTGYGTVLTDVIDPKTGDTLFMYENYGIESLIGPSDKYDMIYLKSDGIYGYGYENDTDEMLVSEDKLPLIAASFNSSYNDGKNLLISLNETGSSKIYEADINTGEVISSDFSGCDAACVSPDGTLYYISSEFMLGGSDEGYSYETTRTSVYRLEKDGSGTLLFTLPQNEFESHSRCIMMNSAGELMIPYRDENHKICIMVYDTSGNLKTKSYPPESSEYSGLSLCQNEQGDIYAVNTGERSAIYKINQEDYSFQEISDTESYGTWVNGNSGFDIFMVNDVGVYGWKEADNTFEEVILFADIESEKFTPYDSDFQILNASEILCKDGIKLVKADDKRLAELNSREVITLAVSGAVQVRPLVSKFNRENEKCRILLKDYSKYGTAMEWNEFAADSENLEKDIIKGDIPDLIMLDDMDLSSYIVKGIFANLKEFAEKDSEFDMNDISPNITEAFTYKGSLYTIPAAISVSSLFTAENHDRWNYDDLYSVKHDGISMFPYTDSFYGTLSEYLVTAYINDYVDIENKKCDFENGKFAELLDFIKENGTPDDDEEGWNTEMDREYIMNFENVCNFSDFVYNTEKSDWRSDTYYASGWPSEKGGKNFVAPFLSFGISAQSEYKDSAWEFIKFVLRQDLRDYDIYGSLMPSGKQAQEISLKEYTDMYNSNSYLGYSEESEEKYREFLEMPAYSDLVYKNVKRIIRNETAAFFAGETTADDTAKAVQNKVTLYLNEIS